MSRFITTKTDFTLRKKHVQGTGATIYETDYTTISPMPNAFKNEYVIGDSNFKFTTRLGVNGQKKHVMGNFIDAPLSAETDNGAWTLDTIVDSGITEESKVRLKPNYTSIRDFACYGSAVKLIQGTVNGVISDFPAEIYFSYDSFRIFKNGNGYTFTPESESETEISAYTAYNEYGIDIINKNILPETAQNPLRYLSLCGTSYTFIDTNEKEYDFVGYDSTSISSGVCSVNGGPIDVDGAADVTLRFSGDSGAKTAKLRVYRDNSSDEFLYTYMDSALNGCRMRPKKKIVDDYFRNIDDFTAVLLNRDTKPIYRATFETPRDTDTGMFYDYETYVWPTLHGGYNPDLTDSYFSYLDSLIMLGDFYDEYFTDNAWRSLTHEAIKNLDWTYVSNTDGNTDEMTEIDTARIEPIVRIYGRQFDDLKRWTDGIKSINTITYDQKSNTPDYTLTDVLENSGWETKVLHITNDKELQTDALYSGLRTGYTSSDADSEFLRRLKLNSTYLLSTKGTRKGLDAMLSMFGFEPDEYDVHEYVYVFSGKNEYYTSFCNSTSGKSFPYPLAEDVATINKYKINFDQTDDYGDYCGIPVAAIGFESAGTDYSYVVPWYSRGKTYDDGLYFQMNGGWGRKHSIKVDLEIASAITEITEVEPAIFYDETQARIKFASDFDGLIQEASVTSNVYDVFYVTNITDIVDKYAFKTGEPKTGLSNYFVLENADLYDQLGYVANKYGWRNIKETEITNNSTSAGTLVLYLESIKDDTTGNNPHIGGGTYDGGSLYIEKMSNIFGYSTVNKNFIGIDDSACTRIKNYKFDVERQEDNRKCWFFSDDYNVKTGKNSKYDKTQDKCVGEMIEFREVDITEGNCEISNPKADPKKSAPALNPASVLTKANSRPEVGKKADEYFIKPIIEGEEDANLLYTRTSDLNPFNPEYPTDATEKAGEGAANSIVNAKELLINFKPVIPLDSSESVIQRKKFIDEYKQYILRTVVPYLTQMIPSTTILRWTFYSDEVPQIVTDEVTVTGTFEQAEQ